MAVEAKRIIQDGGKFEIGRAKLKKGGVLVTPEIGKNALCVRGELNSTEIKHGKPVFSGKKGQAGGREEEIFQRNLSRWQIWGRRG